MGREKGRIVGHVCILQDITCMYITGYNINTNSFNILTNGDCKSKMNQGCVMFQSKLKIDMTEIFPIHHIF